MAVRGWRRRGRTKTISSTEWSERIVYPSLCVDGVMNASKFWPSSGANMGVSVVKGLLSSCGVGPSSSGVGVSYEVSFRIRSGIGVSSYGGKGVTRDFLRKNLRRFNASI